MCAQTEKQLHCFLMFSSVHITINTPLKSFISSKESVFTQSGFPSNCTNNIIWLLWWGLSRPHLQSLWMRNDDRKNDGKIETSPSKPIALGSEPELPSLQPNRVFLILSLPLIFTSAPYCQCCLFMWYHSSHHEFCVIISCLIHCGSKVRPLCFAWWPAWFLWRSHVWDESWMVS